MSNNPDLELKYHLNRILLINLDEDKKEFSELPEEYNNFNYSRIYIIIVCTQNSLSGTKKHFQNCFQEFIKDFGFDLLSKVDATTQGSRMTTTLKGRKHNYNVRTRVYYKKDMVHLLFNPKKFLNSYNKTKLITTRWSKTNNRHSNESNIIKNEYFDNYPLIMNSYNIFRETYNKKGKGLICVNLNFNLLNGKILSLLVLNKNSESNQNGGATNEVAPLMNNNTLKAKFKLNNNNNKIITTTCTINGIKTNNNNNKLIIYPKQREEITNNNIMNINNYKRLLLKIPYVNKIINELKSVQNKEDFKKYADILINNGNIIKKCDEIEKLRIILDSNPIKELNKKNNKILNLKRFTIKESHIIRSKNSVVAILSEKKI
jgi:hypothetical protein